MAQTPLVGTGPVTVGQSLFSDSSTAVHRLGELVQTNDGRAFRYCKAGATALVAGKLQQSSAEDTSNFQNLTVAAASVGATTMTTSSTVTLTVNQLAGGLLTVVSGTTGAGFTYRIAGNTAATAAVTTITLDDPVVVATTGTVKIDMAPNVYSAVIVNPTTLTSTPIGAAVYNITAAYFGWLQVGGVASLLADGANAVGACVVASNGVAGAVEDAAGPGAQGPQIGSCVTGAADTDYGQVRMFMI